MVTGDAGGGAAPLAAWCDSRVLGGGGWRGFDRSRQMNDGLTDIWMND